MEDSWCYTDPAAFLTAMARIAQFTRMSQDSDSHLDALAILLDAVRHSRELQSWFQGLVRLPERARETYILGTVDGIRRNREPENLITCLGLLAHPEIFRAAASAMQDLGTETRNP
jgi:hypothetical protein